MDSKKILKMVLIIFLIIFIVFMVNTIRKFCILNKIENTLSKNQPNSSHSKIIHNNSETNAYIKGNKEVFITEEQNANGSIRKMSIYDDGEKVHTFYENEVEKRVEIKNSTKEEKNNTNITYFGTENKFEIFIKSIFASIKTVECNGEKCYLVKKLDTLEFGKDETLYINKETGLLTRTIVNGNTTDFEYNCVDDSIFVEPNMDDYNV